MKDLIQISTRDLDEKVFDGRRLNFSITLNLFSLEEVNRVTEMVCKSFVEPFKSSFILETYCHDKDNIKPEKFYEIFCEKIQKLRGGIAYSNFGFSGVKVGKSIKTKKALRESDEKLSGLLRKEGSYLHHEKVMKLTKDTGGESFAEDLFSAIIDCDKAYECAHAYDVDLMYDVHRVNWILYQGSCRFSISVSALGENLNGAANELKQKLFDFCVSHPRCHGFVGLGNDSSKFECEERNYFSESITGLISSDKFGLLEEYNYMDLMFIDGLEWVNVFPAMIAEKIIDMEEVDKKFNGSLRKLSDEVFCLEHALPISEHKRRLYKTIYPHFKNCLRPGYSVWSVYRLRPYWEDVFFLEGEYKIDGLNVIFSRGNFDFITKRQ